MMTTTMKVRVATDRAAALAQRRILPEMVEIEISPDALGDEWDELVRVLLGDVVREVALTDATVAALRSALTAHRERREAADAERAAREAARDADYTARTAAWIQEPTRVGAVRIGGLDALDLTARLAVGVEMPIPQARPGCYGANLPAELDAAACAMEQRIAADFQAAKLAAWEAHREEIRALHAADLAQQAEAAARANAALAERCALRLATGKWTRQTDDYDSRRLSRPWCARVTFPSGPKAIYEFGESSGNWGKAGVMELECRPGDIIAWGQKNLRRPDKSDHTIAVMEASGRMRTVDIAEAYRIARA